MGSGANHVVLAVINIIVKHLWANPDGEWEGTTLLTMAADIGSMSRVRKLLKAGAGVNYATDDTLS